MELLNKQVATFEEIKTLCNNYKKDSVTRKTLDYLEKRLKNLEKLWVVFDGQHTILLETIETKNIPYFTNDIYEKTKHMYESTMRNMMELMALQREQQHIDFDLTGMLVEETDDKLKQLVNQQERNFKALNRAMSKININSITEKWEFEEHLSTLKAKWDPIDKIHWELDTELKGSSMKEDYYNKFEEFEEKYESLKRNLNSKIFSNIHYQKSAPKIDIPEFAGNYIQWLSFKDIFLETIHNNPSISKAQKMQHLKTKLKSEAERLVQHLSISAENYDSCWDILSHRYDNRRLQFTSFMNTMQQLTNIQQPNANNLKRMHDVITESMNGLSNMGVEVSSWGPIIVYYMSQKLDTATFNEYSKEMQNNRDLPNLQEFLSFLERMFLAYETSKSWLKDSPISQKQGVSKSFQRPNNKSWLNKHNFNNTQNYAKKSTFAEHNKDSSKTFHASYGQCPLCDSDHVLMQCNKFINMDIPQRNKTVTKLKLCKNCLYSHGNANCNSWKTCRECNLKHHTLLHMKKVNDSDSTSKTGDNNNSSRPSTSTQQGAHHLSTDNTEVLLTTVQVKIKSANGTYIKLRGLLDQGSQVNLITENAAQLLRLPRSKFNAAVCGVGSTSRNCKGLLRLECQSIHSDYTFGMQALVLQRLTNNLPHRNFERANWTHLQNLKLADPDYSVSSSIDLLLGADIYADIILDGVLKGEYHSPIAQQTHLGWILCGKLKTFNCHITLIDTTELSKYWESEDIIQNTTDVNQNDQCENHYKQTTTRCSDGKYVVKMPMLQGYEKDLGKSRSTAIAQFLHQEKRLAKNQPLYNNYKNFIAEYLELQHMKPVTSQSVENNKECYLPHHGVLRDQSTTTKLRVVFNASQRTSSGKSLNSLMEKGPNLQKDIQALIIKWRTYKYAFTADIEKMYRCIWIAEDQQNLQKIIWRNSSNEKLQEYALKTVTYGTKCAPWLAMRTLQQLATDDGHLYPDAAKTLLNAFYVDDLISGHNSLETAKKLQTELILLLNRGGMNLRKWSSNSTKLLETLHKDQISNTNFDFKQEDSMKTLGLGWNSTSDMFTFNWNLKQISKKRLTKRSLLSQISQLYDPLGWFSPVTISAKLIFQRVWTENLEWDELLPTSIQEDWLKLENQLQELKTVKIKRWIGGITNNIELLAFCDASEKAYSCVIYTRVINELGLPVLSLFTAKTRVAPLAQKLSLPRLELAGALLLTQLVKKVLETLKEYQTSVWAWCDSKVVLAWLQGEPSKREKYIENRVSKIRAVISPAHWSYIESKNNPADCATRGLSPKQLLNAQIWWKGPEMLQTFTGKQQDSSINYISATIAQKDSNLSTRKETENIVNHLINNRSSLTRVTRVIAWIMRFKTKARSNFTTIKNCDASNLASPKYLLTNELEKATNIITKNVQKCEFKAEYDLLSKNQPLTNKSSICKLHPFLDEEGIMRVGGRLNKTNLPLGMKNPVILSRNGRLTQLLIQQAHVATLHGGPRLTLAYIRQEYWIVGGNRAVKTYLRRCVRCHRFKQTENYQLMADLPAQRVTPSRPFTHTGVDYTGHVDVKLNKGRGVKTSKGYIAIFVCLATKAVHIELVSDLSTETFLNAFQRMCSRRGTPSHIYSDCGTNFIGASKILNSEYEEFTKELSADFFNQMSQMRVEWHFNAPAWPTAGGLWEAAVRSMKHHLRRVLGEQKLTYEEFSTLLTKIEACMNSRPLCPMTEDPDEYFNYLTPGHFLTGSSTMTLPLSNYEDDRNLDLRRRWQLTENMFHQFWKHWSSDYLTSLQARSKWLKPSPNIKENDIVLVRENNLPPGKWALGRVIEVHPGRDGLVRVTTIKTQAGVLKRPITKLSLLPIETRNKTEINAINNQVISSPKRGQRHTGKKAFFTMLTTLLLLFAVPAETNGSLTEESSSSVRVTSLGSDRPIYYDTIGKVQLIHDEWRLLMYYNLSTYWSGVREIENYLQGIQDLCKNMEPRYCETTSLQLAYQMDLLKYYNNILLTPNKHLPGRNKRGLIDGVGYLANNLFGILDQNFAEKYQLDIEAVKENEDYLLQLIRNQTSIVEIENDILKKSEANMNRQFALINDYMNRTELRLAKIESGIEIAMATSYFSSASLTAHLLLTNLKTIQETLFNTLVDTYKGRMDVHLLSPTHLIRQLTVISGRLPKSLTLPVDNIQDDIKDIYKLLFVKARVTDSYFMYEIHIPLASDEDFIVYHVLPLPLRIKNETTATVHVSSKYIAVNLEKNTYVKLTEKELNNCIQRSPDNFICIINLPVYNLQNADAPCETKLLGHQTSLPCNIQKMKCETAWIELHTTNTWLAVCCGACAIRSVCDGDVTSRVINTSAIITLKQGCFLQTNELKIHSRNNYDSNARMDYNLQVPFLNKTINSIISTNSAPQLKISQDEDITMVEHQLRQLKNKEELPTQITTHDIHQFAICYVLLAVFVITAIVWIAKKRMTFCNKKHSQKSRESNKRGDVELQSRKPDKWFRSLSLRRHPRSKDDSRTETRESATTGHQDYTRTKSARDAAVSSRDIEFNFNT